LSDSYDAIKALYKSDNELDSYLIFIGFGVGFLQRKYPASFGAFFKGLALCGVSAGEGGGGRIPATFLGLLLVLLGEFFCSYNVTI
jgi:MYXO-CTERM domain-containing protein